ncbi:hypothetical protein OC842_006528 [Tilletia horrida]|uniref:Alpha-ketoglutarate-dependent dioxygenase AlkB-like domain-containing protein n=1 Tax=Tilletia horrida TaxID=155126 RepID=A0AAN6G8D6_9BASI|nr:hypothetical protein OC842_006528 [Tilletia horrida]KAK0562468.1 hypothetical protein OC844_002681 [Tilletia horrida]
MPVTTRQRAASAGPSTRTVRDATLSTDSKTVANLPANTNASVTPAGPASKRRRTHAPEAPATTTPGASAPTSFRPVTNRSFTTLHRVHGLHPRAQVFYCADFIEPELGERWKARLMEEMAWYRPTLKVYGRDVVQSRQIAAYATTSDLKLTYSGHPVEMHHPFPPLLTEIATHLAHTLGPEVHFNHVMLNLYEDGSRYIGKHRDNRENLTLAPGSLLVMQGDTQDLYTHEIPKEPKVKDLRISLTFRQLINKT